MKRLLLALTIAFLSNIISAEIRTFESVTEMRQCVDLTVGDIAITKGFYEPNDGGAANYNIITGPSTLQKYPADNWSLIALKNQGLFADLLLSGDDVSICQLGAIPVETMGANPDDTRKKKNFRDCHDNLMAYLALCHRRGHVFQLTCPAGHYFTSPAFLVLGGDRGVRIKGASPKDYIHKNTTVFHAIKDQQEYIWTVSGSEHICHKDYPYIQASGVNISNISFSGQYSGGNKPHNQVSPIAALMAVGLCNSNIDALDFAYIGGSAMVLCNVQETVFGFISVTACGAFYKGKVMPCIWYAAMMGDNGYARTILGRSVKDYAPYKSSRNCSANYYNYINAEGIGGSVIHADRQAVFTHSEIGNIQWEGSFCDFSNMKNHGYDFIQNDGRTDYSYSKNIHADTHPNEKTILCGAFSGWGHDVTIHAITHTWNPMGYAAWYDSTMYRIRKVAAVVMNREDTDVYSNIHLIDYNWRQDFPACWIEFPYGAVMHPRAFSLNTPLPPSTHAIRCIEGTVTPSLNFAGIPDQDIIYPATANNAFMCCHYEESALAPAHLIAFSPSKNGYFMFNYRAGKHYIARVIPKSLQQNKQHQSVTAIYLTYQSRGTEIKKIIQCRADSLNSFCNIDLPLDDLVIDDNTKIKVTMGGYGGSTLMGWDCIYVMDNSPVYTLEPPDSDYNWVGRLWFNVKSQKLYKCTQLKPKNKWQPL